MLPCFFGEMGNDSGLGFTPVETHGRAFENESNFNPVETHRRVSLRGLKIFIIFTIVKTKKTFS
jgi:hypothetical protein